VFTKPNILRDKTANQETKMHRNSTKGLTFLHPDILISHEFITNVCETSVNTFKVFVVCCFCILFQYL